VQSGSGILTITGKRRELPSGSTFSIPQGQAFTLEATSDQPLTIRARLVKAE
jgi:mannose-6-phosphate isomerase-like protein (cupin superfamily)